MDKREFDLLRRGRKVLMVAEMVDGCRSGGGDILVQVRDDAFATRVWLRREDIHSALPEEIEVGDSVVVEEGPNPVEVAAVNDTQVVVIGLYGGEFIVVPRERITKVSK